MKVPSKYYWLTTPVDGVPVPLVSAQLTNPNIAGFRWRQDWSTIQTAATTYDWSAIDAALAACVTAGKLFGLSVDCGAGAPIWVYDTVAEFNFDPANEEGTMPDPFDLFYPDIIFGFIETMGSIYNAHPNVSYVVVSGFMQHFSHLARTADEETRLNISAQGAGYDDIADGWTQVGQAIVGAFVTAFPDTAVIFTSNEPFPSDDGTERIAFRDAIPATFPLRAGWMTDELHADSAPWAEGTAVEWPHGYQAASAGSDLDGIYGAGNVPVPPTVPPQVMIDFINNGLSEGAQFLEIYPFDLDLAANQSAFSTYAPRLTSFVSYVPVGGGGPPPPIVPPALDQPSVTVPTTVTRIPPCSVGTHARNIILGRVRPGPPAPVPFPPGIITLLDVTTPHSASSGLASATWLSPIGATAADMNYRAYLTGGSGRVTIDSQVVDDDTGRALVTASLSNLAPGQHLTLNVSAIDAVSNLEGPRTAFDFISDLSISLTISIKAPPSGVYALVDAPDGVISGDITTRAWLGYAYVNGGTLPTNWAALNPLSPNSFAFTQTDEFLSACDDNSKAGGISIDMGIKAPEWIYSAPYNVPGFDVTGPNAGTIPVPWSPNYLQTVKAFIRQFADRYDDQDSLLYVTVGGMGQLLETLLVQAGDYDALNASAVAEGYPDLITAWAQTSAGILDYWVKSLPRTCVYLALELPVPSTDDGLTGIDDFVQAALATYGDRVGLMTLQLDGLTAADANLSLNSIIRDATETSRAYRFLRPSRISACDPSQDPDTYDAEDGLVNAANAGIDLGVAMEEFYEEDTLTVTSNYPTHFAQFQTDLIANL